MSYITLTPDRVIPVISKYMIGDGFKFVVNLQKSHGSYLHDDLSGREILDFYSCFASSPLGFNHPKLRDERTIARFTNAAVNNVTNSDLYTEYKAEFVETFYEKANPGPLNHFFLISGGTLAVENALKAAFDWKVRLNRQRRDTRGLGGKVLHLRQAFHGRSGYALSLTNTDPVKTDLFPKFDWPRIDNPKVIFPDEGENHENLVQRERAALDQAKQAILAQGEDIAACIVEPIQGEGGDNHFRGEFLRKLQALCNDNDIMFILDEVQTGVGLTGKMWAAEHFDLEPDMICFGKKTQVCGFVCGERIDTVEDNVFRMSSRINSTWGGNLVDMVRATRVFDIMEEDCLLENTATFGKRLLIGLEELQCAYPDKLSNARGRGLMCAFDCATTQLRDEIRRRAFEAGMIILPCGERSLRFRPALVVKEKEIDAGLGILGEILPKVG